MTTTATEPSETATRTGLGILLGLLKSVRPRQWTKNGLILVALFFTINLWWSPEDLSSVAGLVGRSLAGVAIFCAVSGANYLINDVFDIEKDRAHPRKRHRPIASGIVPVPLAIGTGIVLGSAGLGLSFLLGWRFGLTVGIYLALMQAYTFSLKKLVILDVMAVAAGFVVRAVAGSFAIDRVLIGPAGAQVPLDAAVSPWLYICTALGALFIALSKRRAELAEGGAGARAQRAALADYSVSFLDLMIAIVAPSALLAYSLYTFGGNLAEGANVPDNNSMMVTIPFVAYGLFRYLYLVHQKGQGETPEEILLSDWPMLAAVVLWLFAAAGVLLYNA
ncbi:MAG: decaprenyl-phosphate phosphoribosyltransferase [Chloroflexi bacterium]|nr:decaprenyl-phosphate phosphoribosyltransferase [Chloroflexota bacterium]